MDEQKADRTDGGPLPNASPQAPAGQQGVSLGRKIRLGVLICVLVALCAVTLSYKVSELRRRRQRERDMVASLEELRLIVRELSPSAAAEVLLARTQRAGELFQRVKELDPENREVERLIIPVYCATGAFDKAIDLFDGLDMRPALQQIDREVKLRADAALQSAGIQADDDPFMGPAGLHYVRTCATLWALARRATFRALDDVQKATALSRWMALHVLPEAADCAPADPNMVLWRGYASPAQAAWTYAELARQAGLSCRVVVPPGEAGAAQARLVLVEVGGAEPLLVDPYAGVVLMDPESGRPLSLKEVAANQGAFAALAALPGGDALPTGDQVGGASLKTAAYPESCLPRMLAFGYLLRDLPDHPRVALPALRTGQGPIELWQGPAQMLLDIDSEEGKKLAARDFTIVDVLAPARKMHISGVYEAADQMYGKGLDQLVQRQKAAETEESKALLAEGLDYGSFFAALNAYDLGDDQHAETLMRAYLKERPDGRWRVLAQLVLAELLSARGDSAEAKAIWKGMPARRALYGALRTRGFMPALPPLPPKPAPTAEGTQPGAP